MASKTAVSMAFVKLFDGTKMPAVGLGTWMSKPNEVERAVVVALDTGYVHIDCAHVYENEHEIGRALASRVGQDKALKREDLFITSKLWNTDHIAERVRAACEKTLKNLGLSYLDLYLIHWPHDMRPGDELWPKTEDNKPAFGNSDYVDTWKEMEKLVDAGLVRHIGVSNFNHTQMQRVLDVARIPIAVNQVECHPYLAQTKLLQFCNEKKVVLTAYAPLGNPGRTWGKPDDPVLLEDPVVLAIAKKHVRTPAQVLTRFHIDRGYVVIPKSVTPSRIVENFHTLDFKLDEDDIKELLKLDRNFRYYSAGDMSAHPHYPFRLEY